MSWQSGSGFGLEIYTWSGDDVVRLTNNAVADVEPSTHGNTTVWVSGSVPNSAVMYYDGGTPAIVGLSSLAINDPQVDGQDVVWQGFKTTGNNQSEIYYYNGSAVQRLTTNDYSDFAPQVSDGQVVWWGGVFNDFQIYLYDGTTVRQLSTGIRNQYPQIDGPNVVWQGYDGHDYEIYLWNGQSVSQLTDDDVDDTNPQISGNHIVWQSEVPYNGDSQEIYEAYFSTESATQRQCDELCPGHQRPHDRRRRSAAGEHDHRR